MESSRQHYGYKHPSASSGRRQRNPESSVSSSSERQSNYSSTTPTASSPDSFTSSGGVLTTSVSDSPTPKEELKGEAYFPANELFQRVLAEQQRVKKRKESLRKSQAERHEAFEMIHHLTQRSGEDLIFSAEAGVRSRSSPENQKSSSGRRAFFPDDADSLQLLAVKQSRSKAERNADKILRNQQQNIQPQQASSPQSSSKRLSLREEAQQKLRSHKSSYRDEDHSKQSLRRNKLERIIREDELLTVPPQAGTEQSNRSSLYRSTDEPSLDINISQILQAGQQPLHPTRTLSTASSGESAPHRQASSRRANTLAVLDKDPTILSQSFEEENDEAWVEGPITVIAKDPDEETPKKSRAWRSRRSSNKETAKSVNDKSASSPCFGGKFLLLGVVLLLLIVAGVTLGVLQPWNTTKTNNASAASDGDLDCQQRTNILEGCTCQDTTTVPDRVGYNRGLIIGFLQSVGALEESYNETATSCEARNQAILFVSDLNNHVQRPPSNESILQRFVLVLLYAMTNGNFWNSNNLWLDGTVSECLWENVICSEGSGSILELKLQDNNLQGELPSEISMLLSLRHLWLDTNPRLGGTLPSELAGIPSMELSGISTLKTLSISGTSIGGTIPSEFGTLERLTDFLASQTRLEGTLPTELGLLDRLRELDVSFNRLNGTLPISFSSMVNVETLDFSFNSLTGSLPRSWSSLSFLETLDVSHNFLSGFLPEPYGELLAFIDFGGNPDFEGGVPSAYCGLVFLDYLIVDCDSVSIDSESCPCCQCG